MKIRASVRKICTKCRLIRRRGRIRVIVPIRSIDKDRGNLSKKKLLFLISNKVKKSTHGNVQIANKKRKVKVIF